MSRPVVGRTSRRRGQGALSGQRRKGLGWGPGGCPPVCRPESRQHEACSGLHVTSPKGGAGVSSRRVLLPQAPVPERLPVCPLAIQGLASRWPPVTKAHRSKRLWVSSPSADQAGLSRAFTHRGHTQLCQRQAGARGLCGGPRTTAPSPCPAPPSLSLLSRRAPAGNSEPASVHLGLPVWGHRGRWRTAARWDRRQLARDTRGYSGAALVNQLWNVLESRAHPGGHRPRSA